MKISVFLPLLVTSALLAAPAKAQFGVKGGVNFAELRGQAGQETSYKTYYHIGVLYQAHLLGPLSIQPEIQYAQAGGHLKDAFSDYDYLATLNDPRLQNRVVQVYAAFQLGR